MVRYLAWGAAPVLQRTAAAQHSAMRLSRLKQCRASQACTATQTRVLCCAALLQVGGRDGCVSYLSYPRACTGAAFLLVREGGRCPGVGAGRRGRNGRGDHQKLCGALCVPALWFHPCQTLLHQPAHLQSQPTPLPTRHPHSHTRTRPAPHLPSAAGKVLPLPSFGLPPASLSRATQAKAASDVRQQWVLEPWGVMFRMRPLGCPNKWLGFSKTCADKLAQVLPVGASTVVAATFTKVARWEQESGKLRGARSQRCQRRRGVRGVRCISVPELAPHAGNPSAHASWKAA